MNAKLIKLTPKDLQEIFALFSSPTHEEIAMIYNSNDHIFFENENLDDEYELTQEKREYSHDAVRAVLFWLRKHGYSITKGSQTDDLSWLEDELLI